MFKYLEVFKSADLLDHLPLNERGKDETKELRRYGYHIWSLLPNARHAPLLCHGAIALSQSAHFDSLVIIDNEKCGGCNPIIPVAQ